MIVSSSRHIRIDVTIENSVGDEREEQAMLIS